MKRLTQRVWEPKDSVAWEEKCALTRAVATDGAGNVKVALAYSAGVRFCTFAVGLAIRSGPGATWTAFTDATA